MTEPIRRSSLASAMMRSSMDDADALAGLRLLVAGGDLAAVQAAQTRLAELGADATALAGDVEALARAAIPARLARELSLPDRQITLVHRAAPLHDIGKIAIPDSILLKPGRLTDEEFEVVKTHAVLGARVLQNGDSDVIQTAEAIVRHH